MCVYICCVSHEDWCGHTTVYTLCTLVLIGHRCCVGWHNSWSPLWTSVKVENRWVSHLPVGLLWACWTLGLSVYLLPHSCRRLIKFFSKSSWSFNWLRSSWLSPEWPLLRRKRHMRQRNSWSASHSLSRVLHLLAVAYSPLMHLCFFLFTHPPHASPLISPFLPSSPFTTYIHIRVSHSFTVFTVFQCPIWSLLCGFIHLSSLTCSHATQLMVQLREHQKRCELLQEQEEELRKQLGLYSEKFEEFQETLSKSNSVFATFKKEMDKVRSLPV